MSATLLASRSSAMSDEFELESKDDELLTLDDELEEILDDFEAELPFSLEEEATVKAELLQSRGLWISAPTHIL